MPLPKHLRLVAADVLFKFNVGIRHGAGEKRSIIRHEEAED